MTESFSRLRAGFVLLLVILAAFALANTAAAKPPTDDDCLACHSEAMGKGKKAPQKALAGSIHGEAGLSCVDCHADLAKIKELPHAEKLKAVSCSSCHDGMAEKHAFHPMMVADAEAIACQDCHGGHDVVKVSDPKSPVAGAAVHKVCATCHDAEVNLYEASAHGVASASKVAAAPDCLNCHRTRLVTAAEGAPAATAKQAQEKLCLSCHLDSADVRARVAPSAGFIAKYEESVHGRALLAGNEKAANCVDCHGAHTVRKKTAAGTGPTPLDIEKTCGRCHTAIDKVFANSAHGKALAKGVREAPTCTTCHGEHGILKADDPRSPVAAANVSQKVCTPCHSSLRLSEKYGIESDRFQTFEESFHGLAVRGGQVDVANCASCHGSHDILPSSDPASKVSKENLVKTCGACHPGAGARFAQGKIHVDASSKTEEPILWWIGFIYVGLIVGTIAGMFGHNLLDFVKKPRRHGDPPRRDRGRARAAPALPPNDARGAPPARGAGPQLHRPRHHRVHAPLPRLLVGRLAPEPLELGLRGPQRHPPGRRSRHDPGLGLPPLLRDLHRAGPPARQGPLVQAPGRARRRRRAQVQPRPDPRETEARPLQLHREGRVLGPDLGHPRHGRHRRAMWLDNSFMNLFGKLGYDVARSIHYYEAILATLAIIVWHFYFVMFNPDSYPMNTAWFTGKLSHREMEEEHPLELERILEEEEKERAKAEMAAEEKDKA
ncbi:MAG: cytochrome c3 family protein [Holophagales bacterium]|nr:cytochrome c3 family protein [Holophagales bacterium]